MLVPCYEGFEGRVESTQTPKGTEYTFRGVWERTDAKTIRITDLPPIGKEKATQHWRRRGPLEEEGEEEEEEAEEKATQHRRRRGRQTPTVAKEW